MPAARRDAVTAAAKVMARRISTAVSRLPCRSNAKIKPTATICTKPRASDSAVSRST
jgi:hypothetical protein